MFGIGTTELLIIMLVALLVLGPTKLPGIARSLGKALGEFRRVTTDVQRTLNLEAARIEEDEKQKAKAPQKSETKAKDEEQAETIPPPEAADSDPYTPRQADSAPPQKEAPEAPKFSKAVPKASPDRAAQSPKPEEKA